MRTHASQEVGREQRHLDELDHEFSDRLGPCGSAKTSVPPALHTETDQQILDVHTKEAGLTPVHQARLVSSCLNSRERTQEIKILKIARWILWRRELAKG